MAKKAKSKKYKLKTHKGAKARIAVSGSGKLLRRKGELNHLRRKKSKRAKRMVDRKLPVSSADAPKVRRLLPYA